MNIRFKLVSLLIISILFCSANYVSASQAPLKIDVKISNHPDLKSRLINLATEIENIAKLYKTPNKLAYWEAEGKKSFISELESQGYYSAIIDVESSPEKKNNLIFKIHPWQRYKLSNIKIEHAKNSNHSVVLPNLDRFKIKKNKPAIAENLLSVQEEITDIIENSNCLLSLSVSHIATINHFDNIIDITYIIEAGPFATINNIDYIGLKGIKKEYVDKIIGLKAGQCYRRTYINEAIGNLQKSGLFASIKPITPDKTDDDGSVPIIFSVTERKFRSLKAGVSYGTDLGFGASFGWNHRNYFGGGEDLQLDSFINEKEQIIELNYTENFYKRDNQKLLLGAKFENKRSKAFNNIEESVHGFIERNFSPKWTGGYGLRFAQSKVKTDKKTQHYSLISTPLFLKLDTRKNILNPRSGHEFRLEGAPFFSIKSSARPFFKSQISASKYFAFKTKLKPVLAIRGSYGNILGVKSLKLPVNERFYVGGGQSLRGYEYQLAGDLNSKSKPIGGRSFIETSLELRLNITDTVGVVGFIDTGRSYSSISPDFKEPLLHGAGIGARYMTGFGPIRIDVGFPLKRRKFIDKSYQLYFGIGQSF